jgi:hypothetical protein
MKLNDKQIDDLARLLGGIALASLIGFVVGMAGHSPKSLNDYDKIGLSVAFVFCIAAMLIIRKGR